MKILYSQQAQEQLKVIKEYISIDNKKIANQFLQKIKLKIEIIGNYPYIGKINSTMDSDKIRDLIVHGYKAIYKINDKNIIILAIYKYIDFDETELGKEVKFNT
ncbi:MAG: type II toxin-antitoxin system RelE/ParE family toxin [Spirochaetaceae bacterium]|jgi:toxin ParE1/3/4|nr:type II toxin-antitoxin system RelE/ParE family toxin [Spirochaetaceae bacterium]